MHRESRAVWGLMGAAALLACGTWKTERCTPVHTRVLEELRTTEGAAYHVSDPWSCEQHASRLRKLAEELRALGSQDAALRQALEDYRLKVERLAQAYARLAAAYQGQPARSPEEEGRVYALLRREVLDRAASLSAPRMQLQRACGDW